MSQERRWVVRSGSASETVLSVDQWGAFDALRHRRFYELGLVATAEFDENADPFLVRTSLLLFRWGRDHDGERMAKDMVRLGGPDTLELDRATERVP